MTGNGSATSFAAAIEGTSQHSAANHLVAASFAWTNLSQGLSTNRSLSREDAPF
jgi:hypothetical protein